MGLERCRQAWSGTVAHIDSRDETRNEFIRGPKWRTRTTPQRRAKAALITLSIVAGIGVIVVVALIWMLDRLGAPTWLTTLPWSLPTTGALLWTAIHPTPAVATDDDDDSWIGYSIQYVMFGDDEPRPLPVRALAAVLLGAPIAWALGIFGVLSILGLM